MKLLLSFLIFSMFSAEAAEIIAVRLDTTQENILIDMNYWGGCRPRKFSLKMNETCKMSKPVQCQAHLEQETIGLDTCEGGIMHGTAVINLEAAGLKTAYYEGAELTIYGERGFAGDNRAIISLPWKNVNWWE